MPKPQIDGPDYERFIENFAVHLDARDPTEPTEAFARRMVGLMRQAFDKIKVVRK